LILSAYGLTGSSVGNKELIRRLFSDSLNSTARGRGMQIGTDIIAQIEVVSKTSAGKQASKV
jgi:hypothetical protein